MDVDVDDGAVEPAETDHVIQKGKQWASTAEQDQWALEDAIAASEALLQQDDGEDSLDEDYAQVMDSIQYRPSRVNKVTSLTQWNLNSSLTYMDSQDNPVISRFVRLDPRTRLSL